MAKRTDRIKELILKSIEIKKQLISNIGILKMVDAVVQEIINAFNRGNKVLFFGNGGSAADAQHLAAELAGKFYINRKPLPAEALHVNTSYLTAVANDYSYDEVFSRKVLGDGKKGDVIVGISTSGRSPSVVRAIESGNKIGAVTVGLTVHDGGIIKDICRYLITVPSQDTARMELPRFGGHVNIEEGEKDMPLTKPAYPAELRQRIVDLARAGRTVASLAREFEPTENTIRNWIAQADRDAGLRSEGLTTEERAELNRLRRENRRLREEREILKKAAAWFAQETGAAPRKPSGT